MSETQRRSRTIGEMFWGAHVFPNDSDTRRVTIFFTAIMAFGIIFLVSYSRWSTATASWLLGAAAFFAVGMTGGFIFGIPRASQQRVNSNLELISDWLTKILVGVGLTQMSNIPAGLGKLATFIAGGETSSGQDRSFALFVILYFFFGGFVAAYLETRVYLTGAFLRAEGADPEGQRAEDVTSN